MRPGYIVGMSTVLAGLLAAACGNDDGRGSSTTGGGYGGTTGGQAETSGGWTSGTTDGGGGITNSNGGTSNAPSSATDAPTDSDATGSTSSGSDSGGSDGFWQTPYDPGGLPTPSDGNHHAGDNCMTCHSNGSRTWLFGGTVYRSDGVSGAANVQIGVSDGDRLRTTYSGTNGNFWFADDGGSINWANAEARMRNSNGEAIMPGPPAAGCTSCHFGTSKLMEP